MKDLGKAFSFLFKDPRWVSKIVLAAVFMILSIFLIGIFILAGYFIQLTQRVMRREEYPLPEWTDIGVKFVVGFKYVLVYLVYMLPIILLLIPIVLIAIAGAIMDQPDLMGAFATVYMFGFTLLVIPYSLALTLLIPVISYRFAREERMSDALDIGGVLRDFRHNWENTVVVALIALGVESFAGIGILLFLIGIFFTLFYAYALSAYLHGALYLSLLEKGGQTSGTAV
jgi:hypothetical protein